MGREGRREGQRDGRREGVGGSGGKRTQEQR